MATDYNYFYNRAMQDYQPALNAEIGKTQAGLADQGLIASTAGQGTLADVRNKYLSAARQSAQETALNREQQAQNAALKVWEMLNSRTLAYRQLVPKSKMKLPGVNGIIRDFSNTRFLPPTAGSGPTGDPMEQLGFGAIDQPSGKTNFEMTLDAQQADSAASRAIENARLKLQREQFAWQKQMADQENPAADPWTDMQTAALNNLDAADPTGATAGYQAQYQPSQLLDTFKVKYGIDVLSEARKGNENAVAIVRTMYPLTWRSRIGQGGMDGGPVQFGASGRDTWRNPDGSPAAQQNWGPNMTGDWGKDNSSLYRVFSGREQPTGVVKFAIDNSSILSALRDRLNR